MTDGDRIRVVRGPWAERHGRLGWSVTPTLEQARLYPFHGLGKNEVVILLDGDNLSSRPWTCVVDRADIAPNRD